MLLITRALYQVGDTVQILPLPVGLYNYPPSGLKEMAYTPQMRTMAGNVYTIKKVELGSLYYLDGADWTWNDEFLLPAASPMVNDKLTHLLKDQEEI